MSAVSPDPQTPAQDSGAFPGGLDTSPGSEITAVSPATADPMPPDSNRDADDSGEGTSPGPERPRKGPLSFLSGALTSGLLAWLCLGLSQKVVGYYALHPPHYEARVAQSIATALKTMIVGMTFLATFSFAFVGLGLTLVFLRSLLPARPETPA